MTDREREIYWRGYNDALCTKMDGLRNVLTKQQRIEKVVCEYFGVELQEMATPTRKQHIRYPRQLLSYFLTKKTTMGCVKVARLLNQDHSTILHSVSLIKKLLTNNEEVQADVMALEARLNKALQIVQAAPLMKKVEENKVTFYHRPKPEYSNTGHLNLLNRYSEVI